MKKFLPVLLVLLCIALPALADERVIDHAGLLSSQEESALEASIASIAQDYQFDVVLLMEKDIDQAPKYYAADYYDYGGYGYGSNHDGVLFLLSMAERDYYILTTGSGIRVITDYGREQMEADIVPHLSDGDYYTAMSRFVQHVRNYLHQAENDAPLDVGTSFYFDESGAIHIASDFEQVLSISPILLIIALVVALIVVFCLKAQMKTIRRKAGAASYVREGSFHLTRQQDIYLYTTTHRRKIETESKGGSSTFSGSSGRSHGGGGGKF